jgi:hypothetical protein
MTLQDAENIVDIPGHVGPHPEAYHREIFRRLTAATTGKRGDACRKALVAALQEIAKDARKQGSRLNRLLAQ